MGWTAADMPDMTGRRAIVTGGNSGIGFDTGLELAAKGAAVTLACRDVSKAADAAQRIRTATDGVAVSVAALDLASLASIREFAEGWSGPVDLLINNAGVMTPPRRRETADGFELQMGTNHLGHFALTGLLLPRLLDAPPARVVTVSSLAHRNARIDMDDLQSAASYRSGQAYGNSKLANLLFAAELQRRADAAGVGLVSTAAHPGVSATNLVGSRDGLGRWAPIRLAGPLVMSVLFQSAAAGALPTLYAATVAPPGSYSGPQSMRETRGAPGPATRSPFAQDEQLSAELWERSEELTGVRFDWPAPVS